MRLGDSRKGEVNVLTNPLSYFADSFVFSIHFFGHVRICFSSMVFMYVVQ